MKIVNNLFRGGISILGAHSSKQNLSGSFWKLNKVKTTNGIATFRDYNDVYCPDGSTYGYTPTDQCVTYQQAIYFLDVRNSYANNQLVKYQDLRRKQDRSNLVVNHMVTGDTSEGSESWFITFDIYTKINVPIYIRVGLTFNVEIPANSYGSQEVHGGKYLSYDPNIPLDVEPESVNVGYLRPGYDKVYDISMDSPTLG